MPPLEIMYPTAHYVYVLRSAKDFGFYVGYTSQLSRRISEHRLGKVTSTRSRRPLSMVYYEACKAWQDARAREQYLKSGMGKRYLNSRLETYLRNL